jgi:hypothetical protein
MSRREFDHWAAILRANFPDHPAVLRIGKDFRPNTQVVSTHFRNFMSHWWYHSRLRYHLSQFRYRLFKRLGWYKPYPWSK